MDNPFDQFDTSQASVGQGQQQIAQPASSSAQTQTNPFDAFDAAPAKPTNNVIPDQNNPSLLDKARSWANSPTTVNLDDINADKNNSLGATVSDIGKVLGRGAIGMGTETAKGIVGGATDLADRMYDYGNSQPLSIRAIGDLAMTSPAALGKNASVAGTAINKTGNAVSNAVDEKALTQAAIEDQTPLAIKTPRLTPEDMKDLGSNAFEDAKAKNGVLNPQASAAVPQVVQNKLLSTGKMNDKLHGDTLSVLNQIKDDASKGNLSLEDLQQHRQLLNDVINKNLNNKGQMLPDAFKANQAIDALDDYVASIKDKDLASGDPSAIDSFNTGRARWAQAARADDIQTVLERAELSDNPAAAMRAGFKALYTNKARLRGFSDEEQDLIKQAAQTSLPMEAMRTMGSRLLSIAGASSGNPLVAAGTQLGTMGARSLAAGMQAARGNKILDAIANRSMPTPVDRTSAPLKALPPPASTSEVPINLPDSPVSTTYQPTDLNRGDEIMAQTPYSRSLTPPAGKTGPIEDLSSIYRNEPINKAKGGAVYPRPKSYPALNKQRSS